jgi:DNA-binding beta-propeller fold protein YncE
VFVVLIVSSVCSLTSAGSSTSEITWLAAGDSYSSGTGLPVTTGLCDRADSSANPETYAPDAYADLKSSIPTLDRPTLVACSGATSADFLQSDDAEGHPEWTSSMGRFDLVTFTFGGDDINFAGIIKQCIVGGSAIAPADPGHSCPSDSYIRNLISQRLGSAYQSFLTSVADRAVVPGGNIVVLGYPELLALPKYWPTILQHLGVCQGIGTGDATQLRGDAGDLNAAIGHDVNVVNAQHPNGVTLTFLDVNSASDPGPITISDGNSNLFEPSQSDSHNLCGSVASWLNGVVLSNLDIHKSFHPSALGNEAEGRLLAELIPRLPGMSGSGVQSSTPTEMLVANAGSNAISTYDFNGSSTVSLAASSSDSPFGEPTGEAVDPSGNLWVAFAQPAPGAIVEYRTESGGKQGLAQVLELTYPVTDWDANIPTGMTFDRSGDLWIANSETDSISELSAGGLAASGSPTPTVTLTLAGGEECPSSLVFDATGDLWEANYCANSVARLSPSQIQESGSVEPNVVITAPNESSSVNDMWAPSSIAFDASGNLWVADHCAFNVLEFLKSTLGASSTVTPANLLPSWELEWGEPLVYPEGLAFDAAGDLWVVSIGDTAAGQGPSSLAEYPASTLGSSTYPLQSTFLAGGSHGLNEPVGIAISKSAS